ncbi:hypothetical protein V5O48_013256 [Marasmius crinis-equi]|uniref:Uncharacterized protein n=1 Tax=Marasmius crinis-equi TaxID=585013 RepID=A0ABR3F0K5_9AGAR
MFAPKDSPPKHASSEVAAKPKRISHTRTMSPPNMIIEDTPPPPLRALRPSKSRPVLDLMKPLGPPPSSALPEPTSAPMARAPSSLTFGSRSSSRGNGSSISSMDGVDATATVLRPRGHARNRSSLLSSQMGSQGSIPEEDYTTSRPLAPGAKRMLGMKGTMGGSDVSAYAADDIDVSDPDSDIPDELQNILASQSDHEREDTLSFRPPPSPPVDTASAVVPRVELEVDSSSEPDAFNIPVFHANVIDEHENVVDDVTSEEESDHTKRSFDFTGELNKLNESGGSDRRSFVEQLENAFKTPAKIDLRCDFLQADAPPLPPLPAMFSTQIIPEDVSASSDSREGISPFQPRGHTQYRHVHGAAQAAEDFHFLFELSLSLIGCVDSKSVFGYDDLASNQLLPPM